MQHAAHPPTMPAAWLPSTRRMARPIARGAGGCAAAATAVAAATSPAALPAAAPAAPSTLLLPSLPGVVMATWRGAPASAQSWVRGAAQARRPAASGSLAAPCCCWSAPSGASGGSWKLSTNRPPKPMMPHICCCCLLGGASAAAAAPLPLSRALAADAAAIWLGVASCAVTPSVASRSLLLSAAPAPVAPPAALLSCAPAASGPWLLSVALLVQPRIRASQHTHARRH
jgi:hypothetical protein